MGTPATPSGAKFPKFSMIEQTQIRLATWPNPVFTFQREEWINLRGQVVYFKLGRAGNKTLTGNFATGPVFKKALRLKRAE